MYRCVSLAAVAAIVACAPAVAQVQRNFPQNALRGTIAIGEAPAILLNGEPARLAPGARIRNQANLLETPSALLGQKFAAHYTLDLGGLVNQVWVLRGDEARQAALAEHGRGSQPLAVRPGRSGVVATVRRGGR